MKVTYQKNRLLITPETEFEEGVLQNMGDVFKGWQKYNQSNKYQGINLEAASKKESAELIPNSGVVPASSLDPSKVAATVK